eukprot:GEMP01028113.1.p1 GENE.GEMP01028113.1~~GEMP01028113.1.p1  ORF type:complete len:644 (+),score=153.65 GEMP01028113.1:87-2018(+)
MGKREDKTEVQVFLEEVLKGIGVSSDQMKPLVDKFHAYATVDSMREITDERWIKLELSQYLLNAIKKQLSVTAPSTRIPTQAKQPSAVQPPKRANDLPRTKNRHAMLSEWKNRNFIIASCQMAIALTKLPTFQHFLAEDNDKSRISPNDDSALATVIAEMDLFAQANWGILLEHLSKDQVERVLDEGVRSATGETRFLLAPRSALGKQLRTELYGCSPHPIRQEAENVRAPSTTQRPSQFPAERRNQSEGQNCGEEEGLPRKSTEETIPKVMEGKHPKVSAVPSTAPPADTAELRAQLERAEQRALKLEKEVVELRSKAAMWEQRARVAEKKSLDIINDPNPQATATAPNTDTAWTCTERPPMATPQETKAASLAETTSATLKETKAASFAETTSTSTNDAMASQPVSTPLHTVPTPARTHANNRFDGAPGRTQADTCGIARNDKAPAPQPSVIWNSEAWRRIWHRNTTSPLSNAWDFKTALKRSELVWALRTSPPTDWDIDVVHLDDKNLTLDMAMEIFSLLNQAKSLRSIRIYNNSLHGDVDKLFDVLAPSHVERMEEIHLTNNDFTPESVIRFLKKFENIGRRSKKTKLIRFDFRDWKPSVKEYANSGALKICHGLDCRNRHLPCRNKADIHIPKYEIFC